MFNIITDTHARSRRGKNVRKGHFVPRAGGSARAAAAALVAAGVWVSGVMCAGSGGQRGHPAGLPSRFPPLYARTFTVTRLANAGPGSLRAAITRANLSLPGRPTLIRFAVRGTITLSSPLPAVSRNVTINGASAPGYALGARRWWRSTPTGRPGWSSRRGSSGAQLLGLAVDDAGGDGITLEASNITLDRNYIGLNRPARRSAITGTGFSLRLRRGGTRSARIRRASRGRFPT